MIVVLYWFRPLFSLNCSLSSASPSPATAAVDSGRNTNKQEWQDAISSGFDRLVAYATEVDKRRKSSDSNSPSSTPQPAHSSTSSSFQSSFENRVSTLSMKFKYRRQSPPSGGDGDRPTSSSSSGSALPPPPSPRPGDGLPEHHPKKRYFAETSKGSGEHGQQRRSPASLPPPPPPPCPPSSLSSSAAPAIATVAVGATLPSSQSQPSTSGPYCNNSTELRPGKKDQQRDDRR